MGRPRSKLRDRGVRYLEIDMTPAQAEQFYDALWYVARTGEAPRTPGRLATLDELRRRIIVAADLDLSYQTAGVRESPDAPRHE